MKLLNHAALAALLLAIAVPVGAQQPPQQPQQPRMAAPGGMPGMLNVELALRQKEQLKLNDSQVSQLEAIRKEIVAERQERARQMIDLESRLAAGLVKREDVRDQFQDKRDDVQKTFQARRDRIARILTQEQQDQLARFQRRMMVQRVRAPRGQGFRRGFGPGYGPEFRGRRGLRPGFGPQFGPRFNDEFGPRRPLPPRPPRAPGFEDEN